MIRILSGKGYQATLEFWLQIHARPIYTLSPLVFKRVTLREDIKVCFTFPSSSVLAGAAGAPGACQLTWETNALLSSFHLGWQPLSPACVYVQVCALVHVCVPAKDGHRFDDDTVWRSERIASHDVILVSALQIKSSMFKVSDVQCCQKGWHKSRQSCTKSSPKSSHLKKQV